MPRYVVTAAMGVTLHPPVRLHNLSEEQRARRAHALKPAPAGGHELTAPVMFKYGETVELAEADVPKPLVEMLAAEGSDAAEGVRASAAAQRKADELGVALAEVAGSGKHGAVTVRDVERAAAAGEETAPPPPAETEPAGGEGGLGV